MEQSQPPPHSGAALRRIRILLVDDDPSTIRSLCRVLREARPSFQISIAEDAKHAIEALSAANYDVVVTDLQMPGGGGRAVLEALTMYYPETVRVVHSSLIEADDTAIVRSLADFVVPKSCSTAVLLEAIDRGLKAGYARASGSIGG